MVIHNIMEEVVSARVNSLFEHVKQASPPWFTCDCEDCRLDTITYVLNRIPPKYVVSGRGLNYNISYFIPQLAVDIDTLGMEGLRHISAKKRPYHGESSIRLAKPGSPVFNVPLIIGAVYDGRTFDPLADAEVTLKMNGAVAEMNDVSWANPCLTCAPTKGCFSFYVKHEEAGKSGEVKTHNFVVEVRASGCDPVSYAFDVNLESQADLRSELSLANSYKVPDFYLFPADS